MLSIVIPLLDEQESLRELHRQISAVCEKHALSVEMIFVDDGSTDGSWSIVRELAELDERVFGVRLRRNFGKAAALTAGLNCVRGDYVLTMDADLQDVPDEIPRFLAKLEAGFDVVNGWKKRRHDPWHKVYPSRVFNLMVSNLTGLKLHDHNCGIKMFRSEVARELRLYGDLHRFIPVLAYARGFRVTEIDVQHRSRQFGHSKYGVIRFLRGFLDLLTVKFLTTFGQRPMHLLGGIALICAAAGVLGSFWLGTLWLSVWMLLGTNCYLSGWLAELVVANSGQERITYSVSERTALREEASEVLRSRND